MKKTLGLILTTALLGSQAFAQQDVQVGDKVLSCHASEKTDGETTFCEDFSPTVKGTITSLTTKSDGRLKVTLSTEDGLLSFESSPASIFKTSGCVYISKFDKEVCVGADLSLSTSGPCSGMFDTEIVGVNSHQIMGTVGRGQDYFAPVNWMDACQLP